MDAKKVLFIAQEIAPYLPESEIATVCRNLPQGIQERGREIRTFMPKFGNINERRNQLHEVIRLSGMNLIIDDTDHPLIIKVASIQAARMQVYFIDNDDYFLRKSTVADEDGKEFEDNDERCIFYVRGVMETVNPLVHLQEDYEHKLWDHMFIISGFDLDVDSPYPVPKQEDLYTAPVEIPMKSRPVRIAHYGKNIENIINLVADKEDGEEKNAMIRSIAVYMRQQYLIWNKDSVSDETIFSDLVKLSGGRIVIPDGMLL